LQHKLLVIDDSIDMREILTLLFEPEGYTVELACDGLEALAKLKSEVLPALIFLDHEMDTMDGPEFLRELERLHPEILARIPIIMFTGRDLSLIGKTRATEVIAKQVGIHVLLSLVKRYVP
jgi:CheY-like chemotaxis protein